MKVSVACSYYRYTSGGNVLIEIDVPNMVEKINGIDRMSAIRNAIGG
jgi:P2 family phage contractile tail tube protein